MSLLRAILVKIISQKRSQGPPNQSKKGGPLVGPAAETEKLIEIIEGVQEIEVTIVGERSQEAGKSAEGQATGSPVSIK